MRKLSLVVSLSVVAAGMALSAPAIAGDPARGEELYGSRCIACHSPDANRVGPRHRGVVGRVSGSVPGFNYSRAVTRAQVTWDARSLDKWLTNPQAFIPGQRMNFRVNDPTDRADLIAYLMTLK
jgi:cytochrome c